MIVIHIQSTDDTRDFSGIYDGLDAEIFINPSASVLRNALANETDTVVLIGHGSELGLYNERLDGYILSSRDVHLLRGKRVIGIWCYAANFAQRYGLEGFFTSNFISNREEMVDVGLSPFDDCETAIITENRQFSSMINEMMQSNIDATEWVDRLQSYAETSDYQFVRYNYEALYYNNIDYDTSEF